MSTHHRHSPIARYTRVYPFVGPVAGARENRAAHGNVVYVQRCRCGATRRLNANQWHRETGPWEPRQEQSA